jgi:hypothetical protein
MSLALIDRRSLSAGADLYLAPIQLDLRLRYPK